MSVALDGFWRRLLHTPCRVLLRGRISGHLGWRQSLAESELPEPLTAAIGRVVRSTRLWNRERIDVANELIAHFQDGLERGASAEQLLADFGDLKQTAKLIRRSKRRGRPWWWQACWWTTRSLAAFAVVYLLAALWLSTVRPNITTDYLAILNEDAKAVPEEDRAWPLYFAALKMLHDEQAEGSKDSFTSDGWIPEWAKEFSHTPNQVSPKATAWLKNHQEFIANIRAAATKPMLGVALGPGEAYLKDYSELSGYEYLDELNDDSAPFLLSVSLPHIQTLRSISIVLYYDALDAAQRGDAAAAIADVEARLDLARHCGEARFLMIMDVEFAIDRFTCDLLQQLLTEYPQLWSNQELVRLAHRIGAIEYSLSERVSGDRGAFRDFVQQLYSDDGDGNGGLTTAGIRTMERYYPDFMEYQADTRNLPRQLLPAIGPLVYFGAASRKEVLDFGESIFSQEIALADLPLWKQEVTGNTRLDEYLAMSNLEQLSFWPITISVPAIRLHAMALEHARGMRNGVLIGIALELYHREEGKWPKTLDELSPRWLPKLPVDRINGRPLGYRIVNDHPLVYSFGVDTDDDLGQPPNEDLKYEPNAVMEAGRYSVNRPDPNSQYDGDWVLWTTEPEQEVND